MSLLFLRCASPRPITGGPADTEPPKLLVEGSTPNRQTNFDADEIRLVFDEWILLKDVHSQLVVSPPMPEMPEVKQRGKGIVIQLPENLRDETTYTLNFGNAIADLNEGNILENFVFVFSTGTELDSIRLEGSVYDAVTLKPADDVWVMMYFTGEDSAVYIRKPDYLAKTNDKGQWSMSFLPADSFEVVALKDENLNFLYDQESELFGWLPEPVYTGDQTGKLPDLYVFPREKRVVVKEVIHYVPGWLKIVVDAPAPKPTPALLPPIDTSLTMWQGDTLHVWYHPVRNYAGYVILRGDSTQVKTSTQPSAIDRPLLIKPVNARLKPGGAAVFSLNVPITSIDTNLIQVHHDSLGTIPLRITRDSGDIRRFTISGPWLAEKRYPLLFLPGAITDFWGRMNDTILESIVVTRAEQFGDLIITIGQLDSTKQYIVLLKEGDQIIHTFVVSDKTNIRSEQRGLQPGNYVVEIIEDQNRNGTWDTGNYEEKRQPEWKMIFPPEKLRADWEQEIKLTWK